MKVTVFSSRHLFETGAADYLLEHGEEINPILGAAPPTPGMGATSLKADNDYRQALVDRGIVLIIAPIQ